MTSGHFALRAGLHDERLGAVIADPPVTDLEEMVSAMLPEAVRASLNLRIIPPITPAGAQAAIREHDPAYARFESALVRRLGARDLRSALGKLREFDLDKMKARDLKIRRPLLLLVAAADGDVVLSQAREVARGLGEQAILHRFGEEALESMQIDNLPALHVALFDWLAESSLPDQSRMTRAASADASSKTRLTATPR